MGPEWIVVGIVAVVVIFGVNKLPQIARNVGKAQGEFKKGLKEGVTEDDLAGQQPATPHEPPPATAPPADTPSQPAPEQQGPEQPQQGQQQPPPEPRS